MDVHRLEQIAQQLVARVRDDAPECNGRWLTSVTSEEERWGLLFLLAAAVPDDRTWRQMTLWADNLEPRDEVIHKPLDGYPQAPRQGYQQVCRQPYRQDALESTPLAHHSGRELLDELVVERFGPRPNGRRAA